MVNEINGAIHRIGAIETIKTKSGKEFRKRTFVIMQNRFNPNTGEQYDANYVSFDLTQAKCEEIDAFKEGDTVSVAFTPEGRIWVNPDGEEKCFTSLRAYKIDPYFSIHENLQQSAQQPLQQTPPPQYESSSTLPPKEEKLPF